MRIAHQQAVQAKLALTANRTGGNEGGEGAGGCEKVNQTAVAVQVMNYGGDHTNEQMSAATLNLSNLGLHFSNVDHRLQNCGNGGDLGSVSYGVTLLPIPLNLTSTESEGTAASDVTLLGKEANLRDAFVIPDSSSIVGKNVLLIDDFVDSRWTLTLLGESLLSSGASGVFPVTIASYGS